MPHATPSISDDTVVPTEDSEAADRVALPRGAPVGSPAAMLALVVAVVAALRSTARSRLELATEISALRHQVAVLRQRAPRRLRLGRTDRFVWVLLSRLWRGWRETIQIVSPDTVVAWHRRGFGLYWRWRSRPRGLGRPAISRDLRDLLVSVHAEQEVTNSGTNATRFPPLDGTRPKLLVNSS